MRITCFVNTRESFQKGEYPILLVFPYVVYYKAKMCLRISSLLTMQMRVATQCLKITQKVTFHCNLKRNATQRYLVIFKHCVQSSRYSTQYHVKNFIGRTKFPMKTKLFDFFTAGSPLCNCHLAKLREYLRVLMFFYGDDVSVMEKF